MMANTDATPIDLDHPIVIQAVPRSGSNLMRMLISAHPEAFIPANSVLLDALGKPEIRWREIRLALEQEWSDARRDEQDLLAALRQIFFAFWTTSHEPAHLGKSRFSRWGFIDYEPPAPTGYIQLNEIFPSARLVHVVRDGRDVVASWLANWDKAAWGMSVPRYDATAVARMWVTRLAAIPSTGAHVVRLEDLAEPTTRRAMIEAVFAWCGLNLCEPIEAMIRDLPRVNAEKATAQRWRTDLDEHTLTAILAVRGFAPTLEQFGYPR